MTDLARHFPEEFDRRIRPHYADEPYHRRNTMAGLDEPCYQEWQNLIRSLSEARPILIDAIWSLQEDGEEESE